MKLALWQTAGFPADPASNLAALDPIARAAAAAGAKLLLCPECWLCGYNIGTAVATLAEPHDGPSAARIAAIAGRHGIAITYGYAEREAAGGPVYNSVQVLGPAGTALSHYRKTHLFGAAEHAAYQPGDRFEPPFEFGGFKVGLLICFDVEYPEAVRSLALMGAQLLLVPTALTDEFGFVSDLIVPARAAENRIHVAYCNHGGVENGMRFLGASRLVGRGGMILAAAGAGEALIMADIGPPNPSGADGYPYLEERRPELYGRLIR